MDQAHQQDPIVVRTRLAPRYYEEFQCLAGACRDTCCAGWGITFSKKDYLKIKRAPKSPDVEELTRQAMRRLPRGQTHYAEFLAKEGPCPFQSAEGLCRLQLACGAETLPQVCQRFPRHDLYTAMGYEEVMSTACEAVVAQLWDLPEGIDFVEEPLPRSRWKSYLATRNALRFPAMREEVIDTLQARALSLPQRLLAVGLLLDHARQDWEDFSLSDWRRRAALLREDPTLTRKLTEKMNNISKFLAANVKVALMMQNAGKPVGDLLEGIRVTRKETEQGSLEFHYNVEAYQQARQAFADHFGDCDYFFENLLVNQAFWMKVPAVDSPEALWKSYVELCSTYSFFRFMAVLSCGLTPSREKLFHGIVLASRGLMHNRDFRTGLRDQFFENQNESLAHMAMLVQA